MRGLFGMSGIGDDLRAQWQATIADFQAKRVALDQAEQDLYAVYDTAVVDSTDAAEWGRNLQKIKSAQSTMDGVASAVATIADYWNRATDFVVDQSRDNVIYDAGNTVLQTVTGNPYDSIGTAIYGWFHSSGLNGAMRRNGALGALGVLPVVFPITLGALAVIIGVAAATVASVAAYITYINTKKDRVQQLIDAGVDPVEAVKTATAEAKASSGYSFGASLQSVAGYAVVGVLAVVFGPSLVKALQGRK